MYRWGKYKKGDHVYAWSPWLDEYGCYIPICGMVIKDNSKRGDVTIRLDKNSAFCEHKTMTVHKCRIYG